MAIGNEDKTPHCPQSRTKPKAKAKEGILPNDTINAFVVTSISCTTHNDTTVSLFCQTCDDLVCFKCVSSSPDIKHSPHRDHKHTHLVHAYDIQKENLQNKIVKLQETLSAQSNLRQKLLQRLQIFKFEVLRKKTQLSRCARSLKSKVVVNERACQRQLEMLVQPAIERIDGIFQEVDYDVVSGSGLMGAAESLQQMSVRDRLPFLKNVCRVMREVDALLCKHYSIRDSDTMDNPPELLSLGSVSIDRDRETRVLHKVLLLATCVPSKPRLLFSWCTVGAHSASIVWKYNKSDVVDKFVIKHHPTTETLDKEVDGDGPNGECGLVDGDRARVGSGCVTINKFMSGRVQATLLRLKPDTEYSFHLIAINRCGESEPLVACLQTSPVNKNVNQDVYFPPTESSKEKTIDEHSKMFWFYMFLVCVVFILFVILPRFLLSADPVCEKICFGKAWCQAPCWNYVVGTEVFRRDVAKVIMRLLPRSLLHYFVPQVKEEVIFKPDKWWLEWLDFEL